MLKRAKCVMVKDKVQCVSYSAKLKWNRCVILNEKGQGVCHALLIKRDQVCHAKRDNSEDHALLIKRGQVCHAKKGQGV